MCHGYWERAMGEQRKRGRGKGKRRRGRGKRGRGRGKRRRKRGRRKKRRKKKRRRARTTRMKHSCLSPNACKTTVVASAVCPRARYMCQWMALLLCQKVARTPTSLHNPVATVLAMQLPTRPATLFTRGLCVL